VDVSRLEFFVNVQTAITTEHFSYFKVRRLCDQRCRDYSQRRSLIHFLMSFLRIQVHFNSWDPATPICCQERIKIKCKVRLSHTEITYSQQTVVQAAHWQPTLLIPEHLGSGSVGLVTLEIFPLKLPQLAFSLDSAYNVTRILPRSFFGVICQCHIQHSFVFNLLDQNSIFFQELAGMRQSVAVPIESNDSERWELHLKPSKGYF
jgi:hypothetical protein